MVMAGGARRRPNVKGGERISCHAEGPVDEGETVRRRRRRRRRRREMKLVIQNLFTALRLRDFARSVSCDQRVFVTPAVF